MSDSVNKILESTVNPISNGLRLTEEVIKRLDDLRIMDTTHLKELFYAETRRIDEQIELRQSFQRELAQAESKRLDAIRAVDVAGVSTASERAAAQAILLAKNVTDSAETLRQLVAVTAATVAKQLEAVSGQLIERIALLERAQYENKGKTGVTDPMMEGLIKKLEELLQSRSVGQGSSMGMVKLWGIIVGALTIGAVIVTLIIKLAGG